MAKSKKKSSTKLDKLFEETDKKKTSEASSSHEKETSSTTRQVISQAPVLLAAEKAATKWRNMGIRSFTTLLMISAFFFVLASGYIWSIVAVMTLTVLVYREVIYIAYVPAKDKNLKWFKTMSWYFLITTEYFLHGESIIYYFKEIVMIDAVLLPFATHHRFISFMLYVLGFVFFVTNLKKGGYQSQIAQFGWTHMALFLVVVQSHFIIDNILEGLIWFVMPVSLVVINDIFAYICGFFWGKTPLIQISPKKTVEGFVGALLCTLVLGFCITSVLMQSNYLICPVQDLAASAWSNISCEPKNPVFTAAAWRLPSIIRYLIKLTTFQDIREIWIAPVQLHTVIMACFASLIAPVGGFFASAVKRAFKIKDFGDTIPGHGGLTDRMDCQFLMGFFAHVYYHSFIKMYNVSVGTILALVINNLSQREQVELLARLNMYLENQDIMSSNIDALLQKAHNLLQG
ncbi:phosphatidate cytidylyltransferase [Spinellus fusiger]|nr:phosphatidate cytidylyltransferase [Spinellus fusiger]